MSYQLNFDGNDDYIDIPSISISNNFTIEIEIDYVSSFGSTIFVSAWPKTNGWYIGTKNDKLNFFHENITEYNGTTLTDGEFYKIKIDRVGSSVNIYLDNNFETSLPDAAQWGNIERFGSSLDNQFYTPSKLRWWSFKDGVDDRFYDANDVDATGSVLVEAIQNKDGTINNFPTDDSQCVFFDRTKPIPINLNAVNIETTSVLLNWSQS